MEGREGKSGVLAGVLVMGRGNTELGVIKDEG